LNWLDEVIDQVKLARVRFSCFLQKLCKQLIRLSQFPQVLVGALIVFNIFFI
jgi:hypothetical protein